MEYSNGVRQYVLEWYYKVFEPTYDAKTTVNTKVKVFKNDEQILYESRIALTTAELVQATKNIRGKSYTSNQILQMFIYPLMNQGYIDDQESELDHRIHIFCSR